MQKARSNHPTMPPELSRPTPRLAAPIVMAHGLFGFRRIGLGPLTLAWYFRGIPEALRAAGNRVLVTRVHPTAGVARRSRKLGEQIREAFPDEPVHLIGHSMGGLDARALVADPWWQGRILSLTTIATPHLGSALADFAKLRVGRIYSVLERLGIDHAGFMDVTPAAARDFNRRTAAPRGLPTFSVAGDPDPSDVCWPLRRLHAALCELEGHNDGLVSVGSANAFGEPLPTWPVDHLRQMNWFPADGGTLPFPSVARYYGEVLAHLATLPCEADRLAEFASRETA
ncbi:esterase/lipase family protein [Tundrisphaera sp. TA3]|uniref:esterase/lipase family protein n=1 Tax=Tundrisphaera sp. TA3 TaxID=3435775 RepID=UPI003EC0FA35